MLELRKDKRGLSGKISPLLPREDYKISHVYQLNDMRKCGKISKPRMSRYFWWPHQDSVESFQFYFCLLSYAVLIIHITQGFSNFVMGGLDEQK